MFYTYVLKSTVDSQYYIGHTKDLKNRMVLHNAGKVPATFLRRPLKLVYYEAGLNEKNSIKREKYFKTGYGRKFLDSRI